MTSLAPARSRTSTATLAGVGFMLLGVFLFAANDAMGKWLVGSYGVGQILFVRSLAALAVLAPFWRRASWRRIVRPERIGLHLARGACSALEVALFYWALGSMSLATVMTFYLAGPIYVTALGALVLGERVGWVRWSAVLAGFGGVLVALGPGLAESGPAALIAIAGSLSYAVLMISTRSLAPAGEVTLITWQVASTLVFGLALLPLGWTAPSAFDWSFLLLLGLVAMTAHVCVNRALLLAPASTVVPYQYTLIVWAVVFGTVFFGEEPTWPLLLGAAIITASGVFIFLREQRLGARAATIAAAAPDPLPAAERSRDER